MPYYEVQNFAAGMDVRKSPFTAPAGTLRVLKNAFVNLGGEIEKRQAFVQFAPAPLGTVGLVAKGDLLYGVQAGGSNIAPTPTTVGTLALQSLPGGVSIAELLDAEQYANKIYTVVLGSDGVEYHHFDGALVAGITGPSVKTYRSKMYRADDQYLRFSAVGAPGSADTGTGAGFIDLAAEDAEMLENRALEVYYDKLAVFSRQAVQLWAVDPDPNKNTLQQTLRQAGTVAPKSVRQYGSGDILYLSQDGIRSLKSREQSLTASVSDIGSPMDPYVKGLYVSKPDVMAKAISILEPANGRYWLVLDTQILVLANYPSPKISAWCIFEPGFTIAYATATPSFVYLRASDGMVYRYGAGAATPVYDTSPVEVELPFLHFDKPATMKEYRALDVACSGTWQVYAGLNPGNVAAEDLLGTVDGPTFLQGQFPVMGQSTHVSLRFRTSAAAPALLNSIMIHYDELNTT